MFKLNEETTTNSGLHARIICLDGGFNYQGKVCNIVAIVTQKTGGKNLYYYDDEGYYCGVKANPSFEPHHLTPNTPTTEEQSLITQMLDVAEGSVRDREEALLKIIRQLRKK